MLELRDDQKEAVNKTIEYLNDNRGNPVIIGPTGVGKSVIIAGLCSYVKNTWKASKILIMTHQSKLVEQDYEKLKFFFNDVGIYSASLKEKTVKDITIGTVGTINKSATLFADYDLIIIDEAHNISNEDEGMYKKIIKIIPKAAIVGLSATPYRIKGGKIYGKNRIFSGYSFNMSVLEAIEKGYICKPYSYSLEKNETWSKFSLKNGDFDEKELNEYFTEDKKVNELCKDFTEKSKNCNYCIVFAISIEHAELIYRYLINNNYSTCIVHSKMKEDINKVIKDFQNKKYKYLINVNILTEGFDAPFIDCVIDATPTMSTSRYQQKIGRGMRIYPGKKGFLVLDYGGNIERHGCIDDPDIQFSELKPKKKGEAPVKQCPNCGLMVHTKTRECPECKYKFPFSNKNKASLKELLSVNQNNILKIEWFAPSIGEKNEKKYVRLNIGSLTKDVSIFFFFDHTNFAKRNSILLWAKFFGGPVPTNTQECYDFLLRIKDKPKYAQIVKNGKYYNVINLFKEDPNEVQRESSDDERTLEQNGQSV